MPRRYVRSSRNAFLKPQFDSLTKGEALRNLINEIYGRLSQHPEYECSLLLWGKHSYLMTHMTGDSRR